MLEDLLLNHLQMEESRFYPILFEKLLDNPHATETMQTLHKNARPLSMEVLHFFQQLNGDEAEATLLNMYQSITTILLDRIAEEENYLMALFQQLTATQ